MSSTYERTFVVKVPLARAWGAFVDAKERENYVIPAGKRGDSWEAGKLESIVDGRPTTDIEIKEVEPMRLIHYREGVRMRWEEGDHSVTDWLDVRVSFEEQESGTRITFTRSGFGEGEKWRIMRETQSAGQDETLADLVFYLETGVPVHELRHFDVRSGSIGALTLESSRGVEIVRVIRGGYAEEAGLRAGDTLVTLGGASIYRRSDILAVQRAFGPGREAAVQFVREGDLLFGSALLSEANYHLKGAVSV